MAQIYSDPNYVLDAPSTSVLSETRPTSLLPSALLALNYTLDELLHIVVHAALHSSPSVSPASTPLSPPTPPRPLAPNEVLTIERFKAALQRVIGTQLGKECILEAEMAIREVVRRGTQSLRGDPALKKGVWGSPVLGGGPAEAGGASDEVASQAEEIFRCLREWIMQISGLGVVCPSTGPANLTTHLAVISPPKPPAADVSSNHLTFLLVLYIERTFTALSHSLLRSISSVTSRSSHSESASVSDVETAFGEDETIWSWVQSMRVRAWMEDEVRKEKERSRSPVIGSGGAFAALKGHKKRQSTSVASGAMSSTTLSGGRPSFSMNATSITASPATTTTSRTSIESGQSGSTAGAGLVYRKNSLGLGIQSQSSIDDPFDQLLNSGQTMKLSMTPDRLRTMEKSNRARLTSATTTTNTNTLSSAPAAPSSSASSMPSKTSSQRRLRARDPQPRDLFKEEDEEQDIDAELGIARRKKTAQKESLLDLLNSEPPWSGEGQEPSRLRGASAPPSTNSNGNTRSAPHSRRPSIRTALRRPAPVEDPVHPTSVAMRVKDSQNSVATTGSTTSAYTLASSGGEDAWISPDSAARQGALKAKDEKRDLASERQVNTDLMDFFKSSPPPMTTPLDRYTFPSDDPARSLSPKKSKGGLRGFMSKVTGSKKDNSSSDEATSPDLSRALNGSQTSSGSLGRKGGSPTLFSGQSVATSASSAAAMRAAGFSDAVPKAATYTPPPGLGSPSEMSTTATRSGSVSSSTRARSEKQSLPLMSQSPPLPTSSAFSSPVSQPANPPVSILIKSNGVTANGSVISPRTSSTSSFSPSATLPPPVPPLPAIDPALPPLASVKPPKRSSSLKRKLAGSISSRRAREASTASTSTTSSLQLPAAETTVAPVIIVPTGLTMPEASSVDSHEQEEAPQPTKPRGVSQDTDQQPQKILQPLVSAPIVPASVPSILPPPLLSPVAESVPPFPVVEKAQPPAPLPGLNGPAVEPSSGSAALVALLAGLRLSIVEAQTKEECVELIDALLEARGGSISALLQQQQQEEANGTEQEEMVEEAEVEEPVEDGDEEQARMAEFFLAGYDFEAPSASPLEDQEPAANGQPASASIEEESAATQAREMPAEVGKVAGVREDEQLARTSLDEPEQMMSGRFEQSPGAIPVAGIA
ncbi:hypothetical protein JCM1840_006366 [Sporobolomyces johnsonii]